MKMKQRPAYGLWLNWDILVHLTNSDLPMFSMSQTVEFL